MVYYTGTDTGYIYTPGDSVGGWTTTVTCGALRPADEELDDISDRITQEVHRIGWGNANAKANLIRAAQDLDKLSLRMAREADEAKAREAALEARLDEARKALATVRANGKKATR